MPITSIILFLLVIIIFYLANSVYKLKNIIKQMEVDKQYQLRKKTEYYQKYQRANAIITDLTFESEYHEWSDFLLSVYYTDINGIKQQGKLHKSFKVIPQKGDNLIIYYDPRTDIISESFYKEQFS